MRGQDFKKWRKSLNLSQKEAAEALGLKRRVVQYYEKGERNGEKVKIPKTVRLACFALASGVRDYQGPDDAVELSEKPEKKRKSSKARREEPEDGGAEGDAPA